MNGKIGASAILCKNSRKKAALCFSLGSSKLFTSFEGEATGAVLATKLILNKCNFCSISIFIDSCAFIGASTLCNPSPSHYLTNIFHRAITIIKKIKTMANIHIKWVPAHKGIVGNEKADKFTKKAITHGSSDTSKLPKELNVPLPYSKAALQLGKEAQVEWLASSCFNRMKHTDPTSPLPSYIKLMMELPRRHASLISQLRTGHFPIAKYLFCIGKAVSLTCPNCLQDEDTIHHLILQCLAHNKPRTALHHTLGNRDININWLLTNQKPMKALIKFMSETGR